MWGTTAVPHSNLSNAIYRICDDQNMNGTFPDSKSSHWTHQNIRVDQVLTIDGYLISCSAVLIQELGGAKWELFLHFSFLLLSTIVILQINWVSSSSWLAPWQRFFADHYFLVMAYPLSSLISFPIWKTTLTLWLPCWPFLNLKHILCPATAIKLSDFYQKFHDVWNNLPLNSSSGTRYVQCTLMKIQSPSSFRRTGTWAGALAWWGSSSYSLLTTLWFLLTVFPRAL